MPDWLTTAADSESADLSVESTALRLGLAVATGLVIAWVYRRCTGRAAQDSKSFTTALILLSALVAMTAMVIDNNVARAFSLVGALAIVRFRTVVEDTRDTAFVIFAVVAGMAAGVGNVGLCLAGVAIVSAVALALAGAARQPAPAAGAADDATQPLLVRIGIGTIPAEELEPLLRRGLTEMRLVRTATARQGAALELTYAVKMPPGGDAVALVRELNLVRGVQHVELG